MSNLKLHKNLIGTKPIKLMPDDSHKSFYGKAKVYSYIDFGKHSGLLLQSYNTFVCACIDGEIIRLWDDYSATTMRHINAFVAKCGIKNAGGKDWWINLPVSKLNF